MISPISPNDLANLLSGGAGTLFGYFMRSQQNRHEISLQHMDLLRDKFHGNIKDQQDARKTNGRAISMMRFVMIGVLGAAILIMFLLPGFFQWPVNIETIHPTGFLNQLWHGRSLHVWHTFHGLVIPDQFWQLCFYMSGFLFGGRK